MSKDHYAKLYKDRTYADVTFVADGEEVKAHKAVLAASCDYFKHSFRENTKKIKVNGTMKCFKELVKFCYLQQIDIADWSYNDKQCLHTFATEHKYGPLMDFMKLELEKRPKVPLAVDTLNEWYDNCPAEELREWIKNNRLKVVKYEDCHKYPADLMLFIMVTFKDEKKNTDELKTVQKNLFQWLFRWRNWAERKEVDVNSLFSRLKFNSMSKDWPAGEIPIQIKLSKEVNDFLWYGEVKTAGWKRHEVLHLLYFADSLDFDQLLDAVLNVVTTQHLHPSSLATIYNCVCKLKSSKLVRVLVDYVRNNTKSIITSTDFPSYPTSVFEFILDCLSDQVMDADTKWLLFTSVRKWMNSNSDEDNEEVFDNTKGIKFSAMLRVDNFIKRYKDDDTKDVTFVFGEHEIKAHKRVLAYKCNYFKQLFDQNMDNRIKMEEIRIKAFKKVIKHCYMRYMDFTDWSLSDKKYLYDLATKFNYEPLMDLVKTELDARPKVPLSAASLNVWYGRCPDEEIREWVKNNPLNIVNCEDSMMYSKNLVLLIMDTICELTDNETDKEQPETAQKKLLQWLFLWINSPMTKEKDVQYLFGNIRLQLVLKDQALRDKTLEKKIFEAFGKFCQLREVDTAGWTCDEVLELLYCAQDYKFGSLLDAVVNEVATKYLEPASLGKIHGLASRLQCNKLRQIIVDYIKNHTMIILTSAEFINYTTTLVVFILENVSSQGMDIKVKDQLLISLWNWKTSKSEDELRAVFTKIQWKDFSRKQLARVLHIFIPLTCLGNISVPSAPAECKGTKRKQDEDSQYRRGVCPRKE